MMKTKTLLLLSSVFLSLFIAETVLERTMDNQFLIRKPNRHFILKPDPRYLPGVSGPTRFTVNRLGLRGDELRDQEIRILTIGGSTTEGPYLDDTEAWPHLLQEGLKQKTGRSVWVGNAGVSGHNTRNHVVQLEKLLGQIPDIDLVVVLVGVNDAFNLHQYYNLRGIDNVTVRNFLLRSSFEVAPRKIQTYHDLQLYQLIRNFVQCLSPKLSPRFDDRLLKKYSYKDYETGGWIEQRRQERQSSKEVSFSKEEWDLIRVGLSEYRSNVEKMILLSQKHQTKILFLTQPALFRPGMPKEDEKLLWFGKLPPATPGEPPPYLTVPDMIKIMGEFNENLSNTAKKKETPLLDLDAEISPLPDSFFDDVHFNELGAARTAKAVGHFICANKILRCLNDDQNK